MHFILCQRERKRHWEVHRARSCVLRFYTIDHFILEGRHPWVSKHHNNCVWGKIYFKEIVSNIRFDLNHSSFTHLVCEFLMICKFLLIYTISIYYVCLSYLFVLLLIFRSVCCSFCFITKVTCWNISNKRQQCNGWSTTNLYPEMQQWWATAKGFQRMWFGGRGKKPISSILLGPLLGGALLEKHLYPK